MTNAERLLWAVAGHFVGNDGDKAEFCVGVQFAVEAIRTDPRAIRNLWIAVKQARDDTAAQDPAFVAAMDQYVATFVSYDFDDAGNLLNPDAPPA